MAEKDPRDVVVVYRTPDVLEAHALAAQLSNEDIDAHVVGDFLGGGLGMTVGRMSMAEIWAPAESSEAAKTLLARWRPEAESAPDGRFRFSLKAALVVMTIIAIGAAGWRIALGILGLFEYAVFLAAMFVVVRRWMKRGWATTGNDP